MKEQQSIQIRQLARERTLYCYSSALERGDFDTVASVLHAAEQDPALERMILEVNEVYQEEYNATVQADDAVLVRKLIREYLPSGMTELEEITDVPPLMVNDVIARLQADIALSGQVDNEITTVTQRLQQNKKPLPEDLSQRGIQKLFGQIGVAVSKRFQSLFRQTAIFLSMGREQGLAHLAAARRQHPSAPQNKVAQKVGQAPKSNSQHEEKSS